MKRRFIIVALLLAGTIGLAAQTIRFETFKDQSNYLSKILEDSWWGDGKVYHGFTFSTELMWPVSGLPADKLHSLRQFILATYASDNVAAALNAKVDNSDFHTALHNAMRKEYFSEGVCSDDLDNMRLVQPSQISEDGEVSFSEQSMELKHIQRGVCVLFFDGSDYCAGAAHPMGGMWTLNYDIERNRHLTLGDILRTDRQAEINRIYCAVVNEWIAENDLQDYNSEPYSDQLNFDNRGGWYIDQDGIVFIFNPYEIAPYAFGIAEITLPVRKYKHLFRPEVLKYWNL